MDSNGNIAAYGNCGSYGIVIEKCNDGLQGPIGPQGPAGPQGPTGPQGPSGLTPHYIGPFPGPPPSPYPTPVPVYYNTTSRASFIWDTTSLTWGLLSKDGSLGGVTIVPVGTGGTDLPIDPSMSPQQKITTVGTITLASPVTVEIGSGVFTDGDVRRVLYEGSTIGSSVTIFGYTLNAAEQLNGGMTFENTYDSTSNTWSLRIIYNPSSPLVGLPQGAKYYFGYLIQIGTADPTITIVFNTLGNVVWTRTSTGVYTGTFNGTVGATTPSTVVATTISASGITTPTGGVAAAAGGSISPRNIYSCAQPAIATTSGTDSTPSVTEQYAAEVFVPANMTVTGVAYFGGSATGSGNIQISMYTAAGVAITAAQTASTAISATDAYQLVPFAVAWAAVGPATYYINEQFNNTGTRFNTHTVGSCGAGKLTGTTFGTFAAQTMPTTFTTALGPIASLY